MGGAAIWFEDNTLAGYGISFDYGRFGIEGAYSIDTNGAMTGTYRVYDFVSLTEFDSGTIIGQRDKRVTKLTLVLEPLGGEPASFKMTGEWLLEEETIPENWTAKITGSRKGTLDPLKIEPFRVDGQIYPRLFQISGPGVITDIGSIEMDGYLFIGPKKTAYGVYEITEGTSETGVFSGKVNPASGKFSFKMVSDDGLQYTQAGKRRP